MNKEIIKESKKEEEEVKLDETSKGKWLRFIHI